MLPSSPLHVATTSTSRSGGGVSENITHHHQPIIRNTTTDPINHFSELNSVSINHHHSINNNIINNNNNTTTTTGVLQPTTTINTKKVHHNDHSSGITASFGNRDSEKRVKKEEPTITTSMVISEEEKIDGQPSIPQQVAHAVVTSIVNSNTVTSNRTIHNFKNSVILKVIDIESELISFSDRVVFGKRSNENLEEEITYEYLKDYYYQNDNPIDSFEKGTKNFFSPSFSFSFKEDQRARMLFFFSMLTSFILCIIPGLMVVSFLPCCIFYWCSDMIKYKSRRARAYATVLFYSSVCLSLCCFLIFVIIIPCALLAEFGVPKKS
nr:unnamed protein product [Naegleria fowleri]